MGALEGDLVGVRDVDRRAGRFGEPAAAGEVVGVVVRFQDVVDLEALLLGEPQVLLDLPFRVDDRTRAGVGDHVGRAAEISVEDLPEVHEATELTAETLCGDRVSAEHHLPKAIRPGGNRRCRCAV